MMDLAKLLQQHIRTVEDFPHAGIRFRDITPLLSTPAVFGQILTALQDAAPQATTHIAAIEARGFIFASAVAAGLRLPFVPIRKPHKLPHKTVEVEYALEYGEGRLAMHADALGDGAAVYLIDDLIATGGTLAAATKLIHQCGGEVAAIGCVVELSELNGRANLPDVPFVALTRY